MKRLLKVYLILSVVFALPILLGRGRPEANAHPSVRPAVGEGWY